MSSRTAGWCRSRRTARGQKSPVDPAAASVTRASRSSEPRPRSQHIVVRGRRGGPPLNVTKGHPSVEGRSGPDPLDDPGPPGQALHHAVGCVAVHASARGAEKSADLERPVPTLQVEALDVGAQGFGDAQSVPPHAEQRQVRLMAPRCDQPEVGGVTPPGGTEVVESRRTRQPAASRQTVSDA